MSRMTDERLAELVSGAPVEDEDELLDALLAERAEVERLNAELAALRERCTPQWGDPTKEQILSELRWHVSENRIVAPALRALLRVWGEDKT